MIIAIIYFLFFAFAAFTGVAIIEERLPRAAVAFGGMMTGLFMIPAVIQTLIFF